MTQSNQEKEIDNICNIIEVGYSYESNNKNLFSRNNYISYRDISKFIASRNSRGTYRSAFRYSSTDIDNALMYGDLYFDLDDVNNFETVRKDALMVLNALETTFHIDKHLIQIYYSGFKGIHLILSAKIMGIEPCNNLNEIYKYIALNMNKFTPFKTVDTQIYDNKRLFRIPNTVNEKSELYKIPLTYEELETLPIEDIRKMASYPRVIDMPNYFYVPPANRMFIQYTHEYEKYVSEESRSNNRHKIRINYEPPCITHILENGATEGVRNITIACLASYLDARGHTLEEITNEIIEWNDKNAKPTPIKELKTTVKSIFNGDKRFGCATLCKLSECSKECKYYKGEVDDPENLPVYKRLAGAIKHNGRQNISSIR